MYHSLKIKKDFLLVMYRWTGVSRSLHTCSGSSQPQRPRLSRTLWIPAPLMANIHCCTCASNCLLFMSKLYRNACSNSRLKARLEWNGFPVEQTELIGPSCRHVMRRSDLIFHKDWKVENLLLTLSYKHNKPISRTNWSTPTYFESCSLSALIYNVNSEMALKLSLGKHL